MTAGRLGVTGLVAIDLAGIDPADGDRRKVVCPDDRCGSPSNITLTLPGRFLGMDDLAAT